MDANQKECHYGKRKTLKFHVFFWMGTLALLALDRFSKALAVEHLKGHAPIPILKNVFCLQYLENRGAAFGILQGQKIFFELLAIAVFAIVLLFYLRLPMRPKYYPLYIAMSLLLSGGGGNFIDRVLRNYVVDFFYFELIDFPIFNVADIYVTCSVILFLFLFLFYYKEEDIGQMTGTVKKHRADQEGRQQNDGYRTDHSK